MQTIYIYEMLQCIMYLHPLKIVWHWYRTRSLKQTAGPEVDLTGKLKFYTVCM